MRVMFDTNTWQKVVAPERFPRDPQQHLMIDIRRAVETGRIQGFISETVATLEAVPKGQRSAFLLRREEDAVQVVSRHAVPNPETGGTKYQFTLQLAGNSAAHPGLKPVLSDRLQLAFNLGFKLVPVPRIGTARPPEIDREEFRIPLSEEQRADVWTLLARIDEVSEAITSRGVGFAVLCEIAARMQQRLGLKDKPWYHGLNEPRDVQEDREIDAAFAEWADGDSVAVHIGYGLDAICTGDHGKGTSRSVFNAENREWLRQAYGTQMMSLADLASHIAVRSD